VREGVARIEIGSLAVRAAADAPGFQPYVLRGPRAVRGAGGPCRLALGRRTDQELHLDAVAHDPGQRAGDQGAIAGLQPVLREAVRDADSEAVVLDLDKRRLTQPRFVVGWRERHLEFPEGRAPDLLRIHRWARPVVEK